MDIASRFLEYDGVFGKKEMEKGEYVGLDVGGKKMDWSQKTKHSAQALVAAVYLGKTNAIEFLVDGNFRKYCLFG